MTSEDNKKSPWLVYYIWGRGGAGYDTPHYIYFGDTEGMEDADLCESIVYQYERWAITAEQYNMRWEGNVIPPREEVEKLIKSMHDRIEGLTTSIAVQNEFLKENY
jgi:hypothetical protein